MDAAAARDQQAGTSARRLEQREAEQPGEGASGDRDAAARDHRPRQAAEPPRRWQVAAMPIGTHEISKPIRSEAAPRGDGVQAGVQAAGSNCAKAART